jgi:hypothetical protein
MIWQSRCEHYIFIAKSFAFSVLSCMMMPGLINQGEGCTHVRVAYTYIAPQPDVCVISNVTV